MEFSDLVYRILVSEKVVSMKEAAADMDMNYDTLYARVHKRVRFGPEEVRQLIRVIKDPRLAEFVLEGTPFIAAERSIHEDKPEDKPEDKAATNAAVHDSASVTTIEAAHILEEVMRSLSDHILDHGEKIRISEEITETERALATLKARLGEA